MRWEAWVVAAAVACFGCGRDVSHASQDKDAVQQVLEALQKNEAPGFLAEKLKVQRGTLLEALEKFIASNQPKEGDREVVEKKQKIGECLKLMGHLRAIEKADLLASYLDYRVFFMGETRDNPSKDEKWPAAYALRQLQAAAVKPVLNHIADNDKDEGYLSEAHELIFQIEGAEGRAAVEAFMKKQAVKERKARLEKLLKVWDGK